MENEDDKRKKGEKRRGMIRKDMGEKMRKNDYNKREKMIK